MRVSYHISSAVQPTTALYHTHNPFNTQSWLVKTLMDTSWALSLEGLDTYARR